MPSMGFTQKGTLRLITIQYTYVNSIKRSNDDKLTLGEALRGMFSNRLILKDFDTVFTNLMRFTLSNLITFH